MSSNHNVEPKKHLVVLEFTTPEGIDPKFIPWTELLNGAVNICNWRDLTPELLQQYALDGAFDDFISNNNFEDVNQAMDALRKAAEADEYIPEEIAVWQRFQDCDAQELLVQIETCYTNRLVCLQTLLQHEVSNG